MDNNDTTQQNNISIQTDDFSKLADASILISNSLNKLADGYILKQQNEGQAQRQIQENNFKIQNQQLEFYSKKQDDETNYKNKQLDYVKKDACFYKALLVVCLFVVIGLVFLDKFTTDVAIVITAIATICISKLGKRINDVFKHQPSNYQDSKE